jgi:uncharacterized YigZ family protein
MTALSFQTILAPAEGSYKESGSKFLAFAFPVNSEVQIKEKLEEVKKKYFDARHHCFAWMLGEEKDRYRAFDDGEPNHSAGDPILGQIRSKNLTNILIVVVRYFGGVKLGVGGLIQAYKLATEVALNNAIIIEQEVIQRVVFRYPYEFTTEVMRLVKEFELKIIQQQFLADCTLEAEVAQKNFDLLLIRVELLIATGHKISFAVSS